MTTILQLTSGRMGRITFFQHLVFIVNLLVAFANGKLGGCFRLRKKQMLFMKIGAFFLLESISFFCDCSLCYLMEGGTGPSTLKRMISE